MTLPSHLPTLSSLRCGVYVCVCYPRNSLHSIQQLSRCSTCAYLSKTIQEKEKKSLYLLFSQFSPRHSGLSKKRKEKRERITISCHLASGCLSCFCSQRVREPGCKVRCPEAWPERVRCPHSGWALECCLPGKGKSKGEQNCVGPAVLLPKLIFSAISGYSFYFLLFSWPQTLSIPLQPSSHPCPALRGPTDTHFVDF